MKIINCTDLRGTEREVKFTGGVSLRPVIASDGMGFGICETHIPKGGPHFWHYPNHLESCYCVSGHGKVRDMETGKEYVIMPGTLYSLDDHERHQFTAFTDVVLISVFNPPLRGDEKHDENGVYK